MPNPKRLTYRELRQRLKNFGIREERSGKGSERIFFDPKSKEIFTATCHNEGQELGIGLLKACVRRFNLPPDFLD